MASRTVPGGRPRSRLAAYQRPATSSRRTPGRLRSWAAWRCPGRWSLSDGPGYTSPLEGVSYPAKVDIG